MRHDRWISTIGFSPADISTEDLIEAYELASLVMFDDELRTALVEFLSEYAVIHHHTEYTHAGGALVFEVVLSAILGPAVFGGGKAAQASGSARYAGVLAALGASFRKFGEALKLQRLRKVWRDADLKNKNHFEAEAKPRPEGIQAQPETPSAELMTVKPGTLRGTPELPHPNANADMVRSLVRQNESAEILSDRGLDVAHLPNMGKKGGNPDLDINSRPADVYSPKSKNPNTIRDNMIHKVEHQAPDIVLNITDSPLSSADILKFLDEKPVNGLKNLYLIDGEIVLLRRF
ncbi:hypothetical protein [Marinobacter sp. SS5-14b]|uniref:CdiA C-terminal domain-containing protein n=1 Tax=Marinobacter sp. SS5-14b TaxID=3050456 RepID=UPI0026DFF092|nr:hypothetical protein [Marinobacter sp. SS5-14b]